VEKVNVQARLILPAKHLVVPHLLLIVAWNRTVHHASTHWVVAVSIGVHHLHLRSHHRRHWWHHVRIRSSHHRLVGSSEWVVTVVECFLRVCFDFFATDGANYLNRIVIISAASFSRANGKLLDRSRTEFFGETYNISVELGAADVGLVLMWMYVLCKFKGTWIYSW